MQKNQRRALIGLLALVVLIVTFGFVRSASAVDDSKEVRQSDFIAALSDTRTKGHIDFLEEGLGVYTDAADSQSKAAEYFAVNKNLADVGEPTLSWRGTDSLPGMQLFVDLNADGTGDGILVGEPKFYSNRWWANNQLNNFIASDSGNTAPGANDGYAHSGPLSDWRSAYPDAKVLAYGFSAGSGVKLDGVITKMTLGDQDYIFTDEQATTVTPTQPTVNSTATVTSSISPDGQTVGYTMKTSATPADAKQGTVPKFKVMVNTSTTMQVRVAPGTTATYNLRCPGAKTPCAFKVFKDGVQQGKTINVNK